MTLFAKPRPDTPPSVLYRVDWVDIHGPHADTDLSWQDAAREWADLRNIVGNYRVRIAPQGGAG